jgi:hypothetical protein
VEEIQGCVGGWKMAKNLKRNIFFIVSSKHAWEIEIKIEEKTMEKLESFQTLRVGA